MNIYDFDKTVISGDSTAHFYLYCLRRYAAVWRSLPQVVAAFVRLFTGSDKTSCKEAFYAAFLPLIDDIDGAVADYWTRRECKLKGWYLSQKTHDDIIISASPEFLLAPVCGRLGVRLLATRVDKHTGRHSGVNCHGEEKVRRLREAYPQAVDDIDRFYSDSHSDDPLARLAKEAIMVKGNRLETWRF